ncbi:MAG: arsenate reductase ArsC [Pseudomonadota bacterium]
MYNILVLCTGNSARSILAEAILNRDGAGRVQAWSAGSNPTGQINPGAIRLLERRGLQASGYRSKSWDEFAADGAPEMHLIVTVCASAAGEICPVWPGAPMTAHWGIEDPASAPQDQIDVAFQIAYHRLSARINAFLALPFERLSTQDLKPQLTAIGDL